jgi:hypothetical protein
MKIFIIVIFVFVIALTSCDKGLEPPPPILKSSLSGMITYVNGKDKWPPADSVIDIRVVAFKSYPPDDILGEITKGNAYYTASLPMFTDTSSYEIEIPDPPLTIKYLVVAQQYGSFLDWRVIGVWTLSGDNTKPSTIDIKAGESYKDLNINVDFDNLPPQPFD